MNHSLSTVHLNLYCDESTGVPLEDPLLGTRALWDYIAILLVPSWCQEALLQRLLDARCLNPANSTWLGCPKRCKWHADNDTEVHYTKLDDTRKYKVACSWLNMLIRQNREGLELVYFYVLGLDRSKLDPYRFGAPGDPGRDITIYNRFFRTAIQKSSKSFFHRYDRIVIDQISHDAGSKDAHPLFPWHSIWRLDESDDKLEFGARTIRFVDSDHRTDKGDPVHSHFIQFIDLILGCTVNILHYRSRDKNKLGASLLVKPLIGDRIVAKPMNKNSSYNYFGRQAVEFFPKTDLSTLDQSSLMFRMRRLDNFYTSRELRIERHFQPSLFDQLGSST